MGAGSSIFSPRYRVATLGILILMTIIAFEAMAVATALPTAARSLHGLADYGWTFTGFMVASVLGMVSSGMYSDAHGARRPLLVGLVLFMTGLVLGSGAQAMWVLVAARVVQGLAVGLLITAMYVVMGEVYHDLIRPRILAALSSAWVVPGLVGPVMSGWITQQLSWRWVFGGLAPFVAVGGLLLMPSLRQLRTSTAAGTVSDPRRIGYALLTAAGIAAVANLGESQRPLSILAALLGVGAMVLGLRRLLPQGTASFASGVPVAVAFRGAIAGVFVGMEVIVPLSLSQQLHYSPTMSGAPLMLSALSWAAASTLQGRMRRPNRTVLVGVGLALIAVAGLGMALVALRTIPGWAAFLAWPFAGFGAGFALTTASVALLEHTNDADRGSDSAALQLADSSMSAVSAAFAGALVATAAHGRLGYGNAFAVVFLTMSAVGLLASTRASRLGGGRRHTGASDAGAAAGEPSGGAADPSGDAAVPSVAAANPRVVNS